MTTTDAARIETWARRALAELAAEHGLDARGLRARAAPIDADARFAHPEEERAVARAIPSRRREHATGRRLAHELVSEAGIAPAPLLAGKRRAPDWPAGIVGSISHAQGVAAVVIAPTPPFAAIGIDVEGADDLAPELVDAVLTPREKRAHAGADGSLGARAKLVFCAKECAYKTWSPSLDAVPEFTDVEIEFEGDAFVARLVPRAGTPFDARMLRGRHARVDERVCAVALRAAL